MAREFNMYVSDIRKLLRSMTKYNREKQINNLSQKTMIVMYEDYIDGQIDVKLAADLIPAFKSWGFMKEQSQ
jgi:hypothetical protein